MMKYVILLYKVKLPLCVNKHHTMKMYGEMDIYLYIFLTKALHGGDWSASCHGHGTLRERASASY